MSNSGDRFYLLEFRNRPALYGDIGSQFRIEGLVVGGGGTSAVLLLPNANFPMSNTEFIHLTDEEWSDFIHRSDDPEILVGNSKIFQRKVRYEVSGAIQQKVWAADGFKCMYCGRKMGDVLMTIDHLIPLELGGSNDTTNYLSACKRCNKDKGSENPETWCARNSIDFQKLKDYLASRKIS